MHGKTRFGAKQPLFGNKASKWQVDVQVFWKESRTLMSVLEAFLKKTHVFGLPYHMCLGLVEQLRKEQKICKTRTKMQEQRHAK
jgi:hypothetical protein